MRTLYYEPCQKVTPKIGPRTRRKQKDKMYMEQKDKMYMEQKDKMYMDPLHSAGCVFAKGVVFTFPVLPVPRAPEAKRYAVFTYVSTLSLHSLSKAVSVLYSSSSFTLRPFSLN